MGSVCFLSVIYQIPYKAWPPHLMLLFVPRGIKMLSRLLSGLAALLEERGHG